MNTQEPVDPRVAERMEKITTALDSALEGRIGHFTQEMRDRMLYATFARFPETWPDAIVTVMPGIHDELVVEVNPEGDKREIILREARNITEIKPDLKTVFHRERGIGFVGRVERHFNDTNPDPTSTWVRFGNDSEEVTKALVKDDPWNGQALLDDFHWEFQDGMWVAHSARLRAAGASAGVRKNRTEADYTLALYGGGMLIIGVETAERGRTAAEEMLKLWGLFVQSHGIQP